jgi:DNA replication protein DnaC
MGGVSSAAASLRALQHSIEDRLARPRVACSRCGKIRALDLPFPLCDVCIDEDNQKTRAEEMRKLSRAIYLAADLPPLFRSDTTQTALRAVTWSTCRRVRGNDKLAVKLQEIIADGEKGCYLVGETGTAKSLHLAAAVYEFASRHIECVWVDIPDLCTRINQTKFKGDPIAEIRLSPVIILDDLTFESQPGPDIVDQLRRLIISSYNQKCRLFISSNLPLVAAAGKPSLHKFLGAGSDNARIVSRINQLCTIIPVSGPDLRLQKNV